MPKQQTVDPDSELWRRSVCALLIALIFVGHPIQTQAVTYITQRFALLSAFFYLAAMVFYLKFILNRTAEETRPKASTCYALSLVSAVVAMFCKQNAFTLPFAIVLVECFFGASSSKHDRARLWRLAPFLLTLAIIPTAILLGGDFDQRKILGLEEGRPSRSQYFFTQFSVLTTYLRLLFFPINQNLDYDYPVSFGLFEWPTIGCFLLLVGIFVLGVQLFKTHRPVSFGILFFFLAFSVESSFISLDNVIYEHRLYLPSVGFFIALMFGFFHVVGKPAIFKLTGFFLGLLVVIFVIGTYHRNQVWKDEVTLWADVAAKSPGKGRAHYNLGLALALRGTVGPAVMEYNRALTIDPKNVEARLNLGVAYLQMNFPEKAVEQYRLALALRPDYADAYYNLGVAYAQLEKKDKAAAYYRKTLSIDPGYAKAHNNLSVYYYFRGEFGKAIDHADRARQEGYGVHPEFLELLKPYRR
ncbi:MAG: tetratricopeptide repeat protein [Nitrospinales bacterium]